MKKHIKDQNYIKLITVFGEILKDEHEAGNYDWKTLEETVSHALRKAREYEIEDANDERTQETLNKLEYFRVHKEEMTEQEQEAYLSDPEIVDHLLYDC